MVGLVKYFIVGNREIFISVVYFLYILFIEDFPVNKVALLFKLVVFLLLFYMLQVVVQLAEIMGIDIIVFEEILAKLLVVGIATHFICRVDLFVCVIAKNIYCILL